MSVVTVGDLLLAKRVELGWSPEQMATTLGCEPAFVTRLERAEGELPRYVLLKQLEALGIPAVDLLLAVGAVEPAEYEDALGLVPIVPHRQGLSVEEWLESVRCSIAEKVSRHRRHRRSRQQATR